MVRNPHHLIVTNSEDQRIANSRNQTIIPAIYDSSPACLLECYLEVLPTCSNPASLTKTVTRTAGESPDKYIVDSRSYSYEAVKTRTDASKEIPDRSLMTFKPI